MIEVSCFYSLSSPWAYLAGPKQQDIVRRHRVRLILKPYDFQAVVPKTGGVPLRTRLEPRRRYHQAELDRWRKRLGMPLVLRPKHYPTQNEFCARMVIAADKLGWDALALSHGLLGAIGLVPLAAAIVGWVSCRRGEIRAAAATLAGAWFFQLVLDIRPCPLCLEQRVPWAILIVLGGAIAGGHLASAPRAALLVLYGSAAAVAVWGAYLGLYHAGIEYQWWPGPASCTGASAPLEGDLGGPLSPSQVIRCDVVPWAMLGVSLAGFNFLFSLAALALAALGGRIVWSGGR